MGGAGARKPDPGALEPSKGKRMSHGSQSVENKSSRPLSARSLFFVQFPGY